MQRLLGVMGLMCVAMLAMGAAKQPAVTDPAKADADFAIQGEYLGEVVTPEEKIRGGAQIIALGDGKFHGVFYIGGLPGDGWDKTKQKHEADGQVANGVVKFAIENANIEIKDGTLTVFNLDGNKIGSVQKVMRKSPAMGVKPPQGAVVLFDGSSGGEWQPGKTDGELLCEGQNSKRKFQGGTLHIEFMLPYEPHGRGQGRGNSGVYLQGRYEVQVLDSFGLAGKNNEAGGIYTVSDPAVNMCFPPLSWQTYDIDFTAAEFADGKKVKNARMTVKHNGVVVQDNVEVPNSTTAAPVKEGPEPSFIHLQNHGHPVRFKNIWFVER